MCTFGRNKVRRAGARLELLRVNVRAYVQECKAAGRVDFRPAPPPLPKHTRHTRPPGRTHTHTHLHTGDTRNDTRPRLRSCRLGGDAPRHFRLRRASLELYVLGPLPFVPILRDLTPDASLNTFEITHLSLFSCARAHTDTRANTQKDSSHDKIDTRTHTITNS